MVFLPQFHQMKQLVRLELKLFIKELKVRHWPGMKKIEESVFWILGHSEGVFVMTGCEPIDIQ